MFARIDKLEKDIAEIHRKTEHMLWIMQEVMKMGKLKQKEKTKIALNKMINGDLVYKRKYPQSFLDCLKGRYKTIEQIQSDLGLAKATVRTYIKLARKDGFVFNTKRSDKFPKGTMSYKLKKGD